MSDAVTAVVAATLPLNRILPLSNQMVPQTPKLMPANPMLQLPPNMIPLLPPNTMTPLAEVKWAEMGSTVFILGCARLVRSKISIGKGGKQPNSASDKDNVQSNKYFVSIS